MRIIVTSERHWQCVDLAEKIVNRLLARFGPAIVIIHSGYPGVDQSFAIACRQFGVTVELRLADFSHVGDYSCQNREFLRRGAELCLILHRGTLSDVCADLAHQAIHAGVATFIIDNDHGKPRRLSHGKDN
jgi:hypothetical protein